MKNCKRCDKQAQPFRKGFCNKHYADWLFSDEGRSKRETFLRSNKKQIEKKRNKEKRSKKNEVKTHSEIAGLLQILVNRIVRKLDDNSPCISCGHYPFTRQAHASHYYSVGSAPELRFEFWNIFKSCSICNNHKSGNIVGYDEGLERLGIKEKVQSLKGRKSAKHTKEELFSMIKQAKMILKILEKKPLTRDECNALLSRY